MIGKFSRDGGLALVSGGSSGIGFACAERLVDRGIAVVILARNVARLEAARTRLRARVPEAEVTAFRLDVCDRAACVSAVEEIIAAHGTPNWLVTSAGIAKPGLFLEQPIDDHEQQMRTNYLGTLHLAHAVAPHMAKAGGGRIVFISSGAGLFGIHGYGAYSPSKFAVRGLAEVLRVELSVSSISVTVAYPPDTDTPQLAAEQLSKPKATSEITVRGGLWSPEEVADRIIHAAERGAFTVTPGWRLTVVGLLHSLIAPGLRGMQRRAARRSFRLRE